MTGYNFFHQAIIEFEELTRLEKFEKLGKDEEFHEAMEPIANCSLCGKRDESSFHIMIECTVLVNTRMG